MNVFLRIIKLFVIIGILLFIGAVIIIPKLLSGPHTSKSGAAAGDIGALNSALMLYQVDVRGDSGDTGPFPATLMQLISDNAPGWAGPYMATITNDPWNNAYIYTSNGSSYTCSSIHVSEYHKAETIRYCFGTGMMESIP